MKLKPGELYISAGTHVARAASLAVQTARDRREMCWFNFNGKIVTAYPYDDEDVVLERWSTAPFEQQEPQDIKPDPFPEKILRAIEI